MEVDPYVLAEGIVAGEHVNGWSIAAGLLARELIACRAAREADAAGFRVRAAYLEDLSERAKAEAAAVPSRENELRAEGRVWRERFERAAGGWEELRRVGFALSERIVARPYVGLVLEYGSEETVAEFRRCLNAV